MKLSPAGREDLKLTITTTPPLTSWSASFDGEVTWVDGTATGVANQYRWKIAGPLALNNPAGTVVLPRGEHSVAVRAIDAAQGDVIIRDHGSVLID